MSYWPFNAKAVRVVSLAIALMAVAVLLLPGGPLYAQEGIVTIYHAENDEGSVTTFLAGDPEGVMPLMIWSLLTDDEVSATIGPDDIADAADFDISDAGVLTFAIEDDKDPPNFEAPADAEGNNEYKVVVQASDGGKTQAVSYFKVIVRVTDEEEAGKVTWTVDPVGDPVAQDLRQFQDGAVLTASVTDPDDVTPIVDTGAITNGITWKWYRGSAIIAGETINTYTVKAADVGNRLKAVAVYTDRLGTGKAAELVSSHPVKQAFASNSAPEFSQASVNRNVAEDTAEGMNIGAPVTATDDDDTVLTYTLGDDVASFDIDSATGQLMTKAELQYDGESPTTSYMVTVTATDPSGAATSATVTITVTNVNEKPMFTAGDRGMAEDHAENAADLDIGTHTAEDPEGSNVTLSLSGDDEGKFELTGSTAGTRMLAFRESPDFEMPGDMNRDNIYEVTVVASDGANTAERAVTVKVTDVEEAGEVTLSPRDALTGMPITATLTDSDGGITDVEWSWHRLADANTSVGDGIAIDGATSATYTPVEADKTMVLKAMASYTDRTYVMEEDTFADVDATAMMFTNTATSMATTQVQDDPANAAPKFEGSRTQRFVMENTVAGTAIGMPVTAVDNDTGQAVTYTLGGADKDSFAIGATNGQLNTKAALDHERKPRHTVRVTATDPSGEANDSATITVTIHVTNVDEGPEIKGPDTTVTFAENDGGSVTTLSARDPEGVMPPMVWSVAPADATFPVGSGVVREDALDAAVFEISDAGVLTFAIGDDKEPPNFEVADDSDTNNEYKVVVQASDGGKTQEVSYSKVTVRVTDEEEVGKVTWTVAPGGNAVVAGLRQFQDGAVLTASVTDPDGDVDASGTSITDFAIDAGITWKWYRGSAEIAGETSNAYTVKAADVGHRLKAVAVYADRLGSADARRIPKSAELVASHPVKRGVASNQGPAFSPNALTRTVAEDASEGMNIGAPVTATDSDDTVLTYTLGGTNAELFDIDSATGQLMAKAELEYDGDNPTRSYVVTVTATDPSGAATDLAATVTITVTAVNEKPTLVGDKAIDHREDMPVNGPSGSLYTYTAEDPEGSNVTLSLSGDDEGKFELTGSTAGTRMLAFRESPDFEMPGDMNRDNIYEVTVVASDGANTAERAVTVKVTDVEEAGEVTLSPRDALTGMPITATLTDSDGGITDVEWSWHRLADANTSVGDGIAIDGATSATYTPVEADKTMVLKAMASYTDRTYVMEEDTFADVDATAMMFTNTATSMATTQVQDDPANAAPKFEGSRTQRFVMENTVAGTAIGMPVTAVDNDTGQAVTYTLGGADKDSFAIEPVDIDDNGDDDKTAGQIKTKAVLDYEEKKRHTITVTATDSSGETNDSASITVTIHVIDVDEAPEIMIRPTGLAITSGPSTSDYEEESGTGVAATYTADGPNVASVRWSLSGDDAGDFTISGGVLSFRNTPNFEMPVDANMDNVYMVTVMVTDGTDMDEHDVMVTVTDVEEMGEVTLWAGTVALTVPPQVGETITGLVDDDDGVTGESWQWSRTTTPDMMASWMDIDGETNVAYTVMEGDTDYYLRVMATYTDAVGTDMDMAYSMPTMMVGAVVDEPGMVTLWAGTVALTMAPQVGETITGLVVDPDGGVTGMMWQWAKSRDMSSWMDIQDATDAVYTVTADDGGYYLRVMATYTDAVGMDTAMVYSMPTMMVAEAPGGTELERLIARYDTSGNDNIEKGELFDAINDYLFGPWDSLGYTKAGLFALINEYLF